MGKRIAISVLLGCAVSALTLLYSVSGVDSSFRGAPFAFLQTGVSLSLEDRYTVHFLELLLDVLIFSAPVWAVLQLLSRKRNANREVQLR